MYFISKYFTLSYTDVLSISITIQNMDSSFHIEGELLPQAKEYLRIFLSSKGKLESEMDSVPVCQTNLWFSQLVTFQCFGMHHSCPTWILKLIYMRGQGWWPNIDLWQAQHENGLTRPIWWRWSRVWRESSGITSRSMFQLSPMIISSG